MLLRPFFHYYGCKWLIGKRYPTPKHKTIIEPFAGAAGYSTRYYDRSIVLVEKDPVVANMWKWLVSVSEAEMMSLPMLYEGQTVDDLGDVCDDAKHFVGFWLTVAVSNPGYRVGGWHAKKLRGESDTWGDTFWSPRMRERSANQLKYIRHWTVILGDYKDITNQEATWFIDPPYSDKAGRSYKHNSIDYNHLSQWCQSREGQVIACERATATWLPFTSIGTSKATKGVSHEGIWYRD